MKHILFVITNFRHGGTNKSLENLLSLIDVKRYKVDVFAMEHFGPYKEMFPNCNILPEDKWISALISHWGDTKGWTKVRSLVVKFWRNITINFKYNLTEFVYKNAIERLIKNKDYDTVVAYSEGVPTRFISYMYHDNKIAWIHCDYSSYMKLNNQPDETEIYDSYKSIVCVSEFTKKVFTKIMSNSEYKVFAIHNIVNAAEIKKLSNEAIYEKKFVRRDFNIISVGRIDLVKQFDLIPNLVKSLKNKGINFIWYLIGPKGYGDAQSKFEISVKENNINDCFIWLGEKDNPYAYISKSDLLVVTSKSEACPYVLNEAKILGVPVLTTDYGSVYEFIDNGLNGIITSIEDMTEEIERLIIDKKLYSSIRRNLKYFEYDNSVILEKFYSLIK